MADDATGDRRRRGQALLVRPGRRHQGHRARLRGRRHRRRHARAPRRSPSSSSRTRWPSRTTARSSRSCARRRWPTTSPASGPRRRSSTEYLNSIYFGNGAYGVESAARVYFGKVHGYDPAASAAAAQPRRRHRSADTSLPAPRSSPRRGGAAGRDGGQPERVRPAQPTPGQRPRAGATSCSTTCSQQALHLATEYEQVRNAPLPTADRHRAAAGAARGAVLHQLGATPDPRRDGARRRTRQRRGVPRLLRRPEDPHHARPEACRRPPQQAISQDLPSGPEHDRARRWWRSTTRPVRCGRWSADRSSTARRTTAVPVQPGHRGLAPARLGVQAVHAGGGAAARLSARARSSTPRRRT